jgi:hypothetical protein
MKNLSITDQSLNIQKKFSAKTQPSAPAKKNKSYRSRPLTQVETLSSQPSRTPLTSFYIYKYKNFPALPGLALYLCFLKIDNSYKN